MTATSFRFRKPLPRRRVSRVTWVPPARRPERALAGEFTGPARLTSSAQDRRLAPSSISIH
jgi:hypothetical protein